MKEAFIWFIGLLPYFTVVMLFIFMWIIIYMMTIHILNKLYKKEEEIKKKYDALLDSGVDNVKPAKESPKKFLGGISGEETSLARYNNKIVKVIIVTNFDGNGVEYLQVLRYNTGYIGDIPPQMNIELDNRAGLFKEWLTREEFGKKYQILYTEI
jgi:hypothetical protein